MRADLCRILHTREENVKKVTGIWKKQAQPGCRDIQEAINKQPIGIWTQVSTKGTGDRPARWSWTASKANNARGQGNLSSFNQVMGDQCGDKQVRELCFKTIQ